MTVAKISEFACIFLILCGQADKSEVPAVTYFSIMETSGWIPS